MALGNSASLSHPLRLPEIQPHVEFLFEQLRASAGVPQIFGSIAPHVHLQTDSAALEGSANLHRPLPV
jgi:hypothetical protein